TERRHGPALVADDRVDHQEGPAVREEELNDVGAEGEAHGVRAARVRSRSARSSVVSAGFAATVFRQKPRRIAPGPTMTNASAEPSDASAAVQRTGSTSAAARRSGIASGSA